MIRHIFALYLASQKLMLFGSACVIVGMVSEAVLIVAVMTGQSVSQLLFGRWS